MSEKNVIATVDVGQLPVTQKGGDADFDEIAKGGDFLARLQLFSKGGPIDKGLIQLYLPLRIEELHLMAEMPH